jgi:hypothetical protein
MSFATFSYVMKGAEIHQGMRQEERERGESKGGRGAALPCWNRRKTMATSAGFGSEIEGNLAVVQMGKERGEMREGRALERKSRRGGCCLGEAGRLGDVVDGSWRKRRKVGEERTDMWGPPIGERGRRGR